MKKLILICIIIIAITFAACNRNAADDDKEFINGTVAVDIKEEQHTD